MVVKDRDSNPLPSACNARILPAGAVKIGTPQLYMASQWEKGRSTTLWDDEIERLSSHITLLWLRDNVLNDHGN